MITITVVGGVGQESRNFGNESFSGVSIVSPDSTPMYDFEMTDSDGHALAQADDIDRQRAIIRIVGDRIKCDGQPVTLTIRDAVDDGAYQVKFVK